MDSPNLAFNYLGAVNCVLALPAAVNVSAVWLPAVSGSVLLWGDRLNRTVRNRCNSSTQRLGAVL